MIRYLPNILSISRLALILPFLLFLYTHQYAKSFYIFAIAGVTDGLDGWLARTFKWQTPIGSFIDPLADKLLISMSFICLALFGSLPYWLVILVFSRDFTICLGILAWYYLVQKELEFIPTWLSKVNTVLQLILVTCCLFDLAFFKFSPTLIEILILLTAATTAGSYVDYVWTWGKKACSSIETAK